MSSHKLFKKSFNAGKCKTSLKLATSRMRLLRIKRQEQLKVVKRNLAQLLQSGQELTARARVEHVYREENTVAAYDLLESFCEQIVARLTIIESQKKCPLDLEEPISSILFASPRCAEIQEFMDIRSHFTSKYGKDFVSAAEELRAGCRVNRMVIEKLSSKTPDGQTKLKMLTAIAKEHNVDWDPYSIEEQVSDPPETKLTGPSEFTSAIKISTEFPSAPKHAPGTKVVDHDSSRRPLDSDFPTNAPSTDASKANSSSQINTRTPSVTGGPDYGTSEAKASPEMKSRIREIAVDRVAQYQREAVSFENSYWNMHFEDATAAAKAAAESAERASIAARAAAELSSLEKMSRQNSTESHGSNRRNVPVELPHSELNETFQEGPAYTSQRREGVLNEQQPRRGYDPRSLKARFDRSGSSQSNVSSHDDKSVVSSMQQMETPPNSPPQREIVNEKWQNNRIERNGLYGDGSINKKSSLSHFSDNICSDSKTETVVENYDVSVVVKMQRMEAHSPEKPLESETLNKKWPHYESDRDDLHGEESINKRSSPSHFNENTFTGSKTWTETEISGNADHHFSLSSTSVERRSSRKETLQPISAYDSAVVFDESCSESENCLDLEDEVVESKFDCFVTNARKSSSTATSTLDPWEFRESGNKSSARGGCTIPSSSTTYLKHQSFSSERNKKATVPSTSHVPPPATFDHSDGLNDSSEEEAYRVSPAIVCSVSSARASLPSSACIDHGSVESSSCTRDEVGKHKKKQAPVLHNSDSDSDTDDSLEGNAVQNSVYSQGGKSSVKSTMQTIKGEQHLNSLKPFSMRVDNLDRVTSPTSFTDIGGPEPSVDSGSDSSSNLKFERLGGLRNKGYIRPPYVRNPSRIYSRDVNSLTNEESTVGKASEVSHASNISRNLKEDQETSKLKESSELQKKKSKRLGRYVDHSDSDEDESIGPGVSFGQALDIKQEKERRPSYRSTVQSRSSCSKAEMLVPVGSSVSMKSRPREQPSILRNEEQSKSASEDVDLDGLAPSVFKTQEGHTPTEQEPFCEVQREADRSGASYQYYELDNDKSIGANASVNLERGSRSNKVKVASVRTTSRPAPFSQSTTRSQMFHGDFDVTSSLDSIVSDESKPRKSVPDFRVEEQPKSISKTPKIETRTSRRSYDYVNSDSDEPTNTGSPLHQSVVNRQSKVSASCKATAKESPPLQPTKLDGPKVVTARNLPQKSAPVSHVQEPPKHTTKTAALGSIKDIKQYGSQLSNKDKNIEPSAPKGTPFEKKEVKTSRTFYHDLDSDGDESTEIDGRVDINMVSKSSKVERTALRDNPPSQPTKGPGSKLSGKVEVPDSKVSSISLRAQPPETVSKLQEQIKTATSDTSRADAKSSDPSVPSTSRENSFQRASHVHPKLPEYDSLLEMFQARRSQK